MADSEYFTSFLDLGVHVERMRGRTRDAIGDGLEAGAEVVLIAMKPMFGVYQGAEGPFPAWAPLSDETIRSRERRGINPADEPLYESGALSESYEVERSGNVVTIGSPIDYAGVQEEGSAGGNVPARSVLGRAMYRVEQHESSIDLVRDVFVDFMYLGIRFRRGFTNLAGDVWTRTTNRPKYGDS